MTPSQLKRQKIAGYVLPMLLGWFLFAWVFVLSIWVLDSRYYSSNNWPAIPMAISWLALFPVSGHAMGIVNAYCWKNQTWVKSESNATSDLLALFWFFSMPLTIALFCSIIGIALIPIHMICFRGGQERGKRWIETNAIEKFIGRKSDWERPDSE